MDLGLLLGMNYLVYGQFCKCGLCEPRCRISLLPNKRQAMSNGHKLIARLDFRGAKALFKHRFDSRHERRTARQEYAINLSFVEICSQKRVGNTGVNVYQITGDPSFKVTARDALS